MSCGIGYPQLCGIRSQSAPPDTGRSKPLQSKPHCGNPFTSERKFVLKCHHRRQATPSKPQQCLVSKLIVIRCGFDFGLKPSLGHGSAGTIRELEKATTKTENQTSPVRKAFSNPIDRSIMHVRFSTCLLCLLDLSHTRLPFKFHNWE